MSKKIRDRDEENLNNFKNLVYNYSIHPDPDIYDKLLTLIRYISRRNLEEHFLKLLEELAKSKVAG